MITRREFVAGVTCCAACTTFAGKMTGQETDAANNEKLVAPCGLYCGACSGYLTTNGLRPGSGSSKPAMECDGCLGGGRTIGHVSNCAIRKCATAKSKTQRCSDCPEFPCDIITDFNNDGITHHGEVLENLRQLRAMGIKDWTKHEMDRWRCSKCPTTLAWYDAECPNCKAPRSDKLFPPRRKA